MLLHAFRGSSDFFMARGPTTMWQSTVATPALQQHAMNGGPLASADQCTAPTCHLTKHVVLLYKACLIDDVPSNQDSISHMSSLFIEGTLINLDHMRTRKFRCSDYYGNIKRQRHIILYTEILQA